MRMLGGSWPMAGGAILNVIFTPGLSSAAAAVVGSKYLG